MSKWTKWLNNFAVDYLLKYLKDNKDMVNETINKKLNIPVLNERQESELIGMVQDIFVDTVEGMRKK